MDKKIKHFLPLFLITVFSVLFFMSGSLEVEAKSIRDGAARIPDSGFPPEQNNVDPAVKRAWEQKKITRGGKNALIYRPESGRNLVYDVYEGKADSVKKRGFHITPSGNYITFDGWAIIHGHHHHEEKNQATYIGLVNKNNSNDRLIFKTAMRANTTANGDVWDDALPKCPKSAKNRPVKVGQSGACNMDYKYTQFRAYIDLRDVFGGENAGKEWLMYIIKNVEGHLVYDQLILPFDTETLRWRDGKVTMKSGQEARNLRMVGTNVIKRIQPNSTTGSQGEYRYFAPGRVYKANRVDETQSNRVSVFYRVYDNVNATVGGIRYRATNTHRWAPSTFWEFGGSQAVLKYEIDTKKCPDGSTVKVTEDCQVNVTINHIDAYTGEVLDTERKKATEGKNYSFSPKKRGTYKDKDGNPYVPIDQPISGKTPDYNFSINFKYKTSLPDPTTIKEIPNGTEGKAKGNFIWRLEKENADKKSRMRLINDLQINGTHFETRKLNYQINAADSLNVKQEKPIDVFVSDPNSLKDMNVKYSFEYEYTNHYQENYKCVDSLGSDCFKWEFTENTPVWDKGKVSKWTETLSADHQYGETIEINPTSDSEFEMIVGRKGVVNGNEDSIIQKSVQREKYTVNNDAISLITQSWLPVNETIQYSSDFDNPLYFLPEKMFYFPNDIDESLQEEYKNETGLDFTNYMIPLRIGEQTEDSITFNTKENFFVTEREGFLFSVPSDVTSIAEIEEEAKQAYEAFTGQEYNDEVLNDFTQGSRYYFNIDGNGEEKPNTWYDHYFVLSKLGLSDIEIQLNKPVKFDKYLIGSPVDDPVISEEYDSVIYEDIEYSNSIVITAEEIRQIKELASERSKPLHSFRSTDIEEKYNQLKNILPSIE